MSPRPSSLKLAVVPRSIPAGEMRARAGGMMGSSANSSSPSPRSAAAMKTTFTPLVCMSELRSALQLISEIGYFRFQTRRQPPALPNLRLRISDFRPTAYCLPAHLPTTFGHQRAEPGLVRPRVVEAQCSVVSSCGQPLAIRTDGQRTHQIRLAREYSDRVEGCRVAETDGAVRGTRDKGFPVRRPDDLKDAVFVGDERLHQATFLVADLPHMNGVVVAGAGQVLPGWRKRNAGNS